MWCLVLVWSLGFGAWSFSDPSTLAQAEELRDPFLFGSRETVPQATGQPRLTGIIWDATNPLAIIDGEPVTVGQTVGGWRVVKIQRDGIVIQRDSTTKTMTPGSPLPSE